MTTGRQDDRKGAARRWTHRDLVLVLTLALVPGLGACRAESPSQDTAPGTVVDRGPEAEADEVLPTSEGAQPTGTDGPRVAEGSGEDSGTDPLKEAGRDAEARALAERLARLPDVGGPPVFDGMLRDHVIAWGSIDGIASSMGARELYGALRLEEGGALVLRGRPGRSGRAEAWETWRMPGAGAPAERLGEVAMRTAAGAVPRAVTIPGRGFLLIRSTDNIDEPGARVNFFVQRAGLDGQFDEHTSILEVPRGMTAFREWSVARNGDAALLCFVGRDREAPALPGPESDDVLCGRVGWDGQWETRPRSAFRGVRGAPWRDRPDALAEGVRVGRSSGRDAMVILRVRGPELDRFFGVMLGADRPGWVDLMGEPVPLEGPLRYRQEPLAATGAQGTTWAIPAVGGSFPRAGLVGTGGEMVGGLRQVPDLGGWLDRPLMVTGPSGGLLLLDDYGMRGERSFLFWQAGPPVAGSMPPPVGRGPREQAVRNGWADDELMVLVTSEPDPWVVVAEVTPLVGEGAVRIDDGP